MVSANIYVYNWFSTVIIEMHDKNIVWKETPLHRVHGRVSEQNELFNVLSDKRNVYGSRLYC